MDDARRVEITSDKGVYKWKFLGFDYSGTAHADHVEFQCKRDGKSCGSLTGRVANNSISGTGTITGIEFTWTARRPLVRPSSAPTRHDFKPTTFYREFSGSRPQCCASFPATLCTRKRWTRAARIRMGRIA